MRPQDRLQKLERLLGPEAMVWRIEEYLQHERLVKRGGRYLTSFCPPPIRTLGDLRLTGAIPGIFLRFQERHLADLRCQRRVVVDQRDHVSDYVTEANPRHPE